jgi:hypothetical protein
MKKYLLLVAAMLLFTARAAFASVTIENNSNETIRVFVHVESHWTWSDYDAEGNFVGSSSQDISDDYAVDVDPWSTVTLEDSSGSGSEDHYDELGNYLGTTYYEGYTTIS